MGIIGGGYYWWIGTPEYSASQIRRAIKMHNSELGLKYIDTDAIFENLWIDMKSSLLSETSGAGGFETLGMMFGLQLVENMKPTMKEQVRQGIESRFLASPEKSEEATSTQESTSMEESLELSTIWQKNFKIEKQGNSTYIELPDNTKIIFTKKLGKRYWIISKIEGWMGSSENGGVIKESASEAYNKNITLTAHPSKVTVDNCVKQYMLKLKNKYYIQEGSFKIYALAVPIQYNILSGYTSCLEKRCNDSEMIKNIQELLTAYEGKIVFNIRVEFIGGQSNYDELKIPKNLEDYIFLENDNGDFVKLLSVKSDNFSKDSVNWLNEEVSFWVDFPEIYEKDGVEKPLSENSKYIKVIINGLRHDNNSIRYELPLSGLFADVPAEIQQLFSDFELE